MSESEMSSPVSMSSTPCNPETTVGSDIRDRNGGIIIGVVFFFILLAVLTWLLYKWKKPMDPRLGGTIIMMPRLSSIQTHPSKEALPRKSQSQHARISLPPQTQAQPARISLPPQPQAQQERVSIPLQSQAQPARVSLPSPKPVL